MFTPPGRSAFPIFTNDDSKPYTGATIAVLTTLAQLQHAVTQFVAHYPSPWGRRWSDGDRRGTRRRAILRRHHNPCSVATLVITSLLVVTVAAWTPVAPPTIAPIAAPRPPSNAPPKIAPAAPPRIAPPTGSCAAASCIGAAIAIVSKTATPSDRYMFSPQNKWSYQCYVRMRRNRGGGRIWGPLGPRPFRYSFQFLITTRAPSVTRRHPRDSRRAAA
jgi:hypothetical protein